MNILLPTYHKLPHNFITILSNMYIVITHKLYGELVMTKYAGKPEKSSSLPHSWPFPPNIF